MKRKKLNFILTVVLSVFLFGCTKDDEDVKPNWEVTYLAWETKNVGTIYTPIYRYNLRVKIKNNTNKTANYIGIYGNIKSGSTIKKRGLYTYTHLIVPNEEHDFGELNGIYFVDEAEYLTLKDLPVTFEEPTVIYED
jgi:hypothetical protein